eukprot:SM011778S25676  [mRNA]  locus=s11778:36:410:+ [translate_table: standard]
MLLSPPPPPASEVASSHQALAALVVATGGSASDGVENKLLKDRAKKRRKLRHLELHLDPLCEHQRRRRSANGSVAPWLRGSSLGETSRLLRLVAERHGGSVERFVTEA